MTNTILITGSTDGIGLLTAKTLLQQGHRVLIHGRDSQKLKNVSHELSKLGPVEAYVADLSNIKEVLALADMVTHKHKTLDALINNAGVLKAASTSTQDGLDVRFVVNAIAPYLLTKTLLPLLSSSARVVNVSSAAQAQVNLDALAGNNGKLDTMDAYSQSKLAITILTRALAESLGDTAPIIVSVNPGSLLGTKMVKEGFGIQGKDIRIGADILVRAALSDEFNNASGKYFDNDSGQFADPHPDALNQEKCLALQNAIDIIISDKL